MRFELTPEYDDDQIYIAACIPYTYSDLLINLKDLMNASKDNEFGYFFFYLILIYFLENKQLKITKLCKSLSGLDIPLLLITDNNS